MTLKVAGAIVSKIDFNSTFTLTGATNKANWDTFCVINLETFFFQYL